MKTRTPVRTIILNSGRLVGAIMLTGMLLRAAPGQGQPAVAVTGDVAGAAGMSTGASRAAADLGGRPTSAGAAEPTRWATPPDPIARVAKQLRVNIAWQVALDAADFSPGIIDGAFKTKGNLALKEYAAANFPATDPFDEKVYKALGVDVDHALVLYSVSAEDAAQVGGTLPDDWNAKAAMSRLNYETLVDCVTEKFHCTQSLLQQLNPEIRLGSLQQGQLLVVPNIRPFPADYHLSISKHSGAANVLVNLGEKTIRVFDKNGGELALFHCSIAKDKNKLPDRDTKVQVIAAPNPNYTFNPSVWPEVKNVTHILTIPPGPRNPVGLAWVSLDLPGYGIHGSPKPEMIGKTGSHGCFRLTNWDALKFAGWVREGMVVKVVNPDTNPQ
ncbi:MAG TPA: L,D-transpeptidase [Phycisphaerae bacterium]